MMNHPVPSPSEPPAAAPRRAPSTAPAVVVALMVFGGFVAYAFLAPATFRTTAEIVLKPTGDAPLLLPNAPDPAQLLRSAAIDDETLEQTAKELGLGSSAAAKQRVETDLEVKRTTPETFDFSFRAATAARAERVADLLARHAAARAVRSLSPATPDQSAAREAARNRSAAELATFIAAHPELTPPAPSVVPVAPKDAPETDSASLRAERDQIQAKLARLPQGAPGSDNPFGEPPAANPEAMRLRRRIAEIDQTLRTRQRAEKKPDPLPKIAPEVEREWKRLMETVANPVVTETPAPAPAFTVMLREAALPSAPIQPDRPKIALFGGVTALLAALGVLLLQMLGSRSQTSLATTARMSSDPPHGGSDPPQRLPSDAPRPGSDPPRRGSDPPRRPSEPPVLGIAAAPGADPTRRGSEPPLLTHDAPRPSLSSVPNDSALADGATAMSNEAPANQKSDPPRPIVAVTATQVVGGTVHTTSSNPPAARPSPTAQSTPVDATPPATLAPTTALPAGTAPAPAATTARPSSSNPPAATAPAQAPDTSHVGPTTSTVVPAAVVQLAPTTPIPEAPVAPPRPTPPYGGDLGRGPAGVPIAKGTLLGIAPLDPRALEATLPASGSGPPPAAATAKASAKPTSEAAAAATTGAAKTAASEPFVQTPSARGPAGARSTLRPPPPDTPKTPTADPVVTELIVPSTPGGAGHQQPEPMQPPEDSWTGPSRAHRRSVNAARRTTQMLGSPIPPVVRSSRPPPERTQTTATPVPGSPMGTSTNYVSHPPEASTSVPPNPSPTTYSYVSVPPQEVTNKASHLNTPPYYQTPSQANAVTGRTPPAPTRSSDQPGRAPGARVGITRNSVSASWAPDRGLDPRRWRSLVDGLMPLAIEGCMVVGVSAIPSVRHEKSGVAAEVALALAEAKHPRILLLEGDFHWPSVHQVMRIEMPISMGLSQQARNVARGTGGWTVMAATPTLHVLAEGVMRSPGLILSVQFEEAVRSLRAYYDFIVIDGPDTSVEVECRALSSVIDGILLVARAPDTPEVAQAMQPFADKRYSMVVGV